MSRFTDMLDEMCGYEAPYLERIAAAVLVEEILCKHKWYNFTQERKFVCNMCEKEIAYQQLPEGFFALPGYTLIKPILDRLADESNKLHGEWPNVCPHPNQ